MKKRLQLICVACACLFALTPCVSAGTVTAHSEASELLPDPLGDGTKYYKYTVTVQWDYSELQWGLSHFDFDLSNTLMCDYALFDIEGDPTGNIRFEDAVTYQVEGDPTVYYYAAGIDGTSNWEESPDLAVDDGAILWSGDIDAKLYANAQIIRYEQPLKYDDAQPAAPDYPDPGPVGAGTFWFYSTYAPVDGTGHIAVKLDGYEETVGNALTGDLPYCVPEPATMVLLGLGGLLLRRKK